MADCCPACGYTDLLLPHERNQRALAEQRVAELEAALREALEIGDSLYGYFEQDHRVWGDPPNEDELALQRLQDVLKGERA